MEVYLQKSSLTLTAITLVPALAMAFGLTVPGIVSDIATETKGAGPWRSVNCSFQNEGSSSSPCVGWRMGRLQTNCVESALLAQCI